MIYLFLLPLNLNYIKLITINCPLAAVLFLPISWKCRIKSVTPWYSHLHSKFQFSMSVQCEAVQRQTSRSVNITYFLSSFLSGQTVFVSTAPLICSGPSPVLTSVVVQNLPWPTLPVRIKHIFQQSMDHMCSMSRRNQFLLLDLLQKCLPAFQE